MDNGSPWLLAIDTSTDWAGVALTDGSSLGELNWNAGRRQTTQVMPAVERLLATMKIGVGSLGAVAVAVGPGSFSGLRVGIALANGIAEATGIATIGTSTIEVTLHGWSEVTGPAIGVVTAGRARYCWACADDNGQPVTGTIRELASFVQERGARVIAGELSDSDATWIRLETGVLVPPEPARLRRAGSLARLGWDKWNGKEFGQWSGLEPIYVHRS